MLCQAAQSLLIEEYGHFYHEPYLIMLNVLQIEWEIYILSVRGEIMARHYAF